MVETCGGFHSLNNQPDLTLDKQIEGSVHDLFFRGIKVLRGSTFNDFHSCVFR